jgi:hypothetical protein
MNRPALRAGPCADFDKWAIACLASQYHPSATHPLLSPDTPSPSVSWLRSHWIEKPRWALEADAPDFRFR